MTMKDNPKNGVGKANGSSRRDARPAAKADTGVTASAVEAPSLSPEALARVMAIVRVAISDAVATAFAALVVTRSEQTRDIDLPAFARAAGFGARLAAAANRLYEADRAFADTFLFHLVDATTRNALLMVDDSRTNGALHAVRTDRRGLGGDDEGECRCIRLSSSLVRLLDEPLPAVASPEPRRSTSEAVLDADTLRWIGALRAAASSNTAAGGHLVLRCNRPDAREMDDLARSLAREGVTVHRIDAADEVPLGLLRAELHACSVGAVVLVAADSLVVAPSDDEADLGVPNSKSAQDHEPTSFAQEAMPWLKRLRQIHVWKVPARTRLSASFDGLVGGCIGPIRYDRSWTRGVLEATLPGVDDGGMLALARRTRDPRDAAAMATTARGMAVGCGIGLGEACAFVASSFAGRRDHEPGVHPEFDPRLLVCGEEALLLLERANQLAANGGRVLAWGPPGGGKSSWARVLATRAAAGRPVVTITPAAILARPWGATERLLRALWTRAADEGATLLVDELDALCAAREPGSSSNNAYLIRCLTDEWLRNFDDHPSVPVVATLNDALAIDDAIRRRFAFVVRFGDVLPPERERLAWEVILKTEPPEEWVPLGASVADITMARARCRMLGLTGAKALAEAIARAREARLGPGRMPAARPSRGRSVH